MKIYHTPVLITEVIHYLRIKENGIYVDATCGEGGHSYAILQYLRNGRLICIDRNEEILKKARFRLKEFKNISFYNETFDRLENILRIEGIKKVDGILADLGISMFHLKAKESSFSGIGLSYTEENPLDMRLSKDLPISAADVLNKFSEKELEWILSKYGEERESRKIARAIIRNRPIKTAKQLGEIVLRVKKEKGKIHPATKTFQALRIFVNKELEILESFIPLAVDKLSNSGRIVIISYHSLEDRLVKTAFKKLEEEGRGKIVTKKVIKPSLSEIMSNKSARSAKMRVFERLGGENE